MGDLPLRYIIPWSLRLLGAWRIMRGRPASCAADMTRMLAAAPYAPEVEGVESILAAGPLLITHNHNHDSRAGLGPWWGTSLVFTTVAHQRGADPAWMVTSEWYYFDRLRGATITPLDPAAG